MDTKAGLWPDDDDEKKEKPQQVHTTECEKIFRPIITFQKFNLYDF